jgi:hypothetical protein
VLLLLLRQGEMSATIMRYASQWGGLIPRLRDRVGNAHADVKMGVGLNFNRLDDTSSVSKTYGSSRLSWLAWLVGVEGGAADAPPIDANPLRALLSQQLDFVSGGGCCCWCSFFWRRLHCNEACIAEAETAQQQHNTSCCSHSLHMQSPLALLQVLS